MSLSLTLNRFHTVLELITALERRDFSLGSLYKKIFYTSNYGSSNGAKFSRFYLVLNYLYSASSYLYSASSYLYSVSSYFIQSSFLYSVSNIVREDIVPHILPCSRFRNNQYELRKRQIQKYKNTKIQKTEY